MATNFPGSLDNGTTLPDPAAGNTTNSPSHASQHATENGAIKAIEAKVGTGASTPVVNTLMYGSGTGTSAWTQLTSAQLAGSLTDETGTGKAVFGTSPTLVTPAVDTINESTPSNGVTVGGVNLKSGALNTNNSVVTANITNAAVTASKLATGAATALVSTSETSATQTFGNILATSGPAVTVTIGANGLALVAIYSYQLNNGANGETLTSFAISGATTQSAADNLSLMHQAYANNAENRSGATFLVTSLTPGSTTFTLQYRVTANTGTWKDRRIAVVPL